MTAVRGTDAHGEPNLVITDAEGDHVEFVRVVGGWRCLVLARTPALVGLDLGDSLALLSFLADAAGVERYVPDTGTPLGDLADT